MAVTKSGHLSHSVYAEKLVKISIPFRTAVDDINNLYNGWYTQRANNIAHLPNAATQVAGTGALGRNHKRMGDCNARSVQCRARSLEGLAPTASAHAARRGQLSGERNVRVTVPPHSAAHVATINLHLPCLATVRWQSSMK
uniref:Uncharacterized protein n=1 Tax=Anopheles coluzzii TaxID=1518534 RepID=A0A8W7PMK2_ANOCL